MDNYNFHLNVCKSDSEIISLSSDNLFLNTVILGNKATGKSTVILKNFVHEIILNKNLGGLFITSTKDLSYELYILAKHHKRRVLYINPSIDNIVEIAINNKDYSSLLSEYNFEKLIFNNYIVIVDVEQFKTSDSGMQFIDFLMSQLEKYMHSSETPYYKPYILCIDDAFNYIDSLENILYYGNEYNIASILFFQNRTQFKTLKKDYTSFLESNIGNTVITNNINHQDAIYYENIFNIDILNNMDSKGRVFYVLRNDNQANIYGFGNVEIDSRINNITEKKLLSTKKNMKKKKLKSSNNTTHLTESKVLQENNNFSHENNEKMTSLTSRNNDSLSNISLLINKSNVSEGTKNDISKDTKEEIKQNNIPTRNGSIYGSNSNKIELTLDWDDDEF